VCTVSIVPVGSGCRLVCNRDERRDRPAALPPTRRLLPGAAACYPLDPLSGGTWIAVTDAGLALALLNRTPTQPGPVPARSRGTVVPHLASQRTVSAVLRAAADLDVIQFAPFRLVVVHRTSLGVATSDGHHIRCTQSRLDAQVAFSSSSLGDDRVEESRRDLFRRLVRDVDDWLAGQAAFHRHRWPDRPDISVVMSRNDARTVSRSTVDLRWPMTLHYEPLEEEG
jgi:hypothetical protein